MRLPPFSVTADCAGCGACVLTCPECAIVVAPEEYEAPLRVLAEACTGCGECAEVCPVEACVEVA
jgi:Pyruvate/2-oxoacid:ferredoxin oxidoreductase delta subunit